MKVRKPLATLVLFFAVVVPTHAQAEEGLERDDSEVEQVIPPAMVDEMGHERSDPIEFDQIVISRQTPADQFVAATTPLVVALMLGSVGLVVVTLARGDKFD